MVYPYITLEWRITIISACVQSGVPIWFYIGFSSTLLPLGILGPLLKTEYQEKWGTLTGEPTVDDTNPAFTLRTLNYGKYGIFLIMGNAGFISLNPKTLNPKTLLLWVMRDLYQQP